MAFFIMEIWKTIPDYEDYQVSSLGNVKSLKRGKEMILKPTIDDKGYKRVGFCLKGTRKVFKVHKLVAMSFHEHVPNGYNIVVDHINNNKLDNRAINIQLISMRENASKDRVGGSSSFVGVSWCKKHKKWQAHIRFNERKIRLGHFDEEKSAAYAYKKALLLLEFGSDLNKLYPMRINSSNYKGITFNKKAKKWYAVKNKKYIGSYNTEQQAINALCN
jgi:hypothetical protein